MHLDREVLDAKLTEFSSGEDLDAVVEMVGGEENFEIIAEYADACLGGALNGMATKKRDDGLSEAEMTSDDLRALVLMAMIFGITVERYSQEVDA